MAGVPFGSSTGLDALTQGVDPVTQGYAYYGKRSADAEPEADAQYLASPYAGFGAYNGLYGLGAYSGAYNLGYAAPSALNYGLSYGYNGLYSRGYYGKREAEPEADAQYVTSPYAGLGAYNGLYGLGAYNGAYSYSAPSALNYGLAYNGLYNGLYSRGYAAAGAPFTGCRNYVGAPVPC